MMKFNLLFIRANVPAKRMKAFRSFISSLNDLLDSSSNLLIDSKVRYFKIRDDKYLLVVPIVLMFPWFLPPLFVVPKVFFFLAFIIRSKFRFGFRPVLNLVVAEVLYGKIK